MKGGNHVWIEPSALQIRSSVIGKGGERQKMKEEFSQLQKRNQRGDAQTKPEWGVLQSKSKGEAGQEIKPRGVGENHRNWGQERMHQFCVQMDKNVDLRGGNETGGGVKGIGGWTPAAIANQNLIEDGIEVWCGLELNIGAFRL